MTTHNDLAANLVEYIERMEEITLHNRPALTAHLASALARAAADGQPRWRTPDEELPPPSSFVAFITDGCEYELGVYGHDDILERTVWMSTRGGAYLDRQVRSWIGLPALPPGHPCEGVILSRNDRTHSPPT